MARCEGSERLDIRDSSTKSPSLHVNTQQQGLFQHHSSRCRMQSTKSFEASLQGVFPAIDLDPILQRCSLLCSSSSSGRFHWREIAFETDRTHPNIAAFSSNPTSARSLDVKILCQRDVASTSEAPWQVWLVMTTSRTLMILAFDQVVLRLSAEARSCQTSSNTSRGNSNHRCCW